MSRDNISKSAIVEAAVAFDGFLQSLGKRLASGDRFLKELPNNAILDNCHVAA